MIRTLAVAATLCAAALAAPPDSTYRLAAFDASGWPRTLAVVDTRIGSAAGIQPADFRLIEDGSATSIAKSTMKFRVSKLGLALIVALDVSPSMQGRPLEAIRQGLSQLVARRRDVDRVTVLSFAGDIRWETRWDSTAAQLRDVFTNLRTRGNQTRMFDAIGQAMDELAIQTRQDSSFPQRQCILVLSDGHDEGSRATLDQTTRRLQDSRVRLDAVGLTHFPLWLRSLQLLAAAGFGGFRMASRPEDLSHLLGDGIENLLDTTVLEFRGERLSADGKPHPVGLEHLPSHWREQVTVSLPKASFLQDRRMWIAAGAVVLGLLCLVYFLRRGRPAAQPPVPVVPSLAPAARTQPRPAPPYRAATVAEPPPPVPTNRTFQPPPAPARPEREPTQLAPQNTTLTNNLRAVAGPYAGRRFPIAEKEFWIGSSPNNHLRLDADPSVSGNHACICREERFSRVFDNGSLNQTRVNGLPIGENAALLRPGDRISIGQSEFVLEP